MATLKAIIHRMGKVSRGKTLESETLNDDMNVIQPHFDSAFYLAANPDVAESDYDPLYHYCRYGWPELRDPNANFSTNFYLQSNPDVSASGLNPFTHFILHGEAEGRPGKLVLPPGFAPASAPPQVKPHTDTPEDNSCIEQVRYHFDIAFYSEQTPGLANDGTDPVAHYFVEGWRTGLDPHPDFSTLYYLEENPDIAEAGINPFWHYIVAGKAEGRDARPAQRVSGSSSEVGTADKTEGNSVTQSPGASTHSIDNEIEALRADFDAAFYLARNLDIAQSGADPLMHYCRHGWRESRDPSSRFSTIFYLDTNPDVAALGVNPFWHYMVAGKHEGRAAQHPGGYKVERLRKTESLEVTTLGWLRNTGPGDLLNADQLEAMIKQACGSDYSRLVLSIGHDNYREVSGGVQLCAQREELLAPRFGAVYLNIHPWQSLPRLAHIEDEPDSILMLVLNGQNMGKCRVSDLIQAVGETRSNLDDVQIVVHQLLGHLPERIAELILASGKEDCWLWLHDFFTVCPSYNLQRNQVSFCGAPKLDSNACTLCRFGAERQSHLARMQTFFETINVHLLAPSQVTRDFWLDHSALEAASIQVVPHVDLDWEKRITPAPQEQDVITLAFLGTPAPHKGWNIFEKLAYRHADNPRYRFVYCGTAPPPCSGVEHVPVHVTADDPDAMLTAVADNQVDLVLHWASWPETFSLSTYEALAGAAYVVTNPISGNVAASISNFRRGVVLNDEADLDAFFIDGRAESMVKTLRNVRHTKQARHQLSNMAYEVIGWEDTHPQTSDKGATP